jgi:hypothetical protein
MVAVIKFQHRDKPPLPWDSPAYQTLMDAADEDGIPLYYVEYGDDLQTYKVLPVNELARTFLPHYSILDRNAIFALFERCGRGKKS